MIVELPRTIEIYGQKFTSVGWCTRHQCPIWPIEEFLYRFSQMPSADWDRIQALNPNGKCEVELPKGSPRSWKSLSQWATQSKGT